MRINVARMSWSQGHYRPTNFGFCFGAESGESFNIMSVMAESQSIDLCHFQWLWMTPNPEFKSMPLYDVEYLGHYVRQGHSYNWVLCSLSNDVISNDPEWPLEVNIWPTFSISQRCVVFSASCKSPTVHRLWLECTTVAVIC